MSNLSASDLLSQLAQELSSKTQNLTTEIDLPNDQQEQWLETNLQQYIQQKQNNILGSGLNQDQIILNFQNLLAETSYLTLQAQQEPDKAQNYLQQYQSILNKKEQRLLSW